MNEETRTTEMLRGMFHYLGRQGFGFRYDREDMGRFFHAARESFPEVLGDYHFLTRLTGGYSPAIEAAFEHLRSVRVIERRFGGFQPIDIFDVNKRVLRDYARTYEKDPLLEQLAAEFQEQFGHARLRD